MAYDLFVTQAAHEDLEDALGYIAKDRANPSAAANLLDQVQAAYEQLKDFPMLYESCHDLRLRNLGYRKVVIGNLCCSIILSRMKSGCISCGSSTAVDIMKN